MSERECIIISFYYYYSVNAEWIILIDAAISISALDENTRETVGWMDNEWTEMI